MSGKKIPTTQIGRDAKTGHFVPVREAERRPSTTVIETIRRPSTQAPTKRK